MACRAKILRTLQHMCCRPLFLALVERTVAVVDTVSCRSPEPEFTTRLALMAPLGNERKGEKGLSTMVGRFLLAAIAGLASVVAVHAATMAPEGMSPGVSRVAVYNRETVVHVYTATSDTSACMVGKL